MLTSRALQHFGSRRAIASALRLSRAAVYQWGPVVPYASAKRLTELVPGLQIDPDLYDARLRPRPKRAKG
jgi:hypothetical protein